MIYVSEIKTDAPQSYKTPLEEQIYRELGRLGIRYERVESDEVITMEDCAAVDERLNMKMVKTLFLCNRQRSEFYLFVTCGDKPFRSGDFSRALGVSRVSFAPAELMESMLGTRIGAATVLSCLPGRADGVRVVIDRDVLREEFYGCSDGTTTGYMKLRTSDVTERFLPATCHRPEVISV